jgi:tetratricopeptide (TPR) repeat protein
MSRRRTLLLILASIALLAGSYIVSALRQKASAAPLSQTTIGLDDSVPAPEMKTTDELIAFWRQRFDRDPHDFISLTYLGQSYMHKGRETGDASQYERADAIFRKALQLDSQYEPAQAYLSADLFVKHDFSGSLQLASQVYKNDPRALQALATVGDAQLELGRYPEAEVSYGTLAEKAPSAAVYGRLARLAWLQGRTRDAISWLQKAVDDSKENGLTGEGAAWYEFQLGELFFNTNQLSKADTQYHAALKDFDNYYLALAGVGKVLAAQGRYNEAIPFYEKAVAIIPQPDLLAALGDLYSITGSPDKAKQEYDTVEFIGKLQALNQIIYNRQLALFEANHDVRLADSLSLAQNELLNRKDIYGYDAAAWALYKNGYYTEALQDMREAMRLGTRDALLYYHAGMIHQALGDPAQARNMLSEALSINPHFDLLQARTAARSLQRLEKEPVEQ